MGMRKIICILLVMCISLATFGCSKSNENKENEAVKDSENVNIQNAESLSDEELHWEYDFETRKGVVEQTYVPEFTGEEWKDLPCLNFYINLWSDDDNWNFDTVEDELNYYLYKNNYGFSVNFIQPYLGDVMSGLIGSPEEEVKKIEESGTAVDLYVTFDYASGANEEKFLCLSDYLNSDDGKKVYDSYEDISWKQLTREDGKVYGVPLNFITTKRFQCVYNPQVVEYFGININLINGDFSVIKDCFDEAVDKGTCPIRLCLDSIDDILMCPKYGLDIVGNIIAIQQDENDMKAMDFLEYNVLKDWYCYLGELKEKGWLSYSTQLLEITGLIQTDEGKKMDSLLYDYILFDLTYSSDLHAFFGPNDNTSYDNANMNSNIYVYNEPAYVHAGMEQALVINTNTEFPEYAQEFITLFVTNQEIRNLLYCGIEGLHYKWEGDTLVFDEGVFGISLGLESDRRFLQNEKWSEKYTNEIEALNENVYLSEFYEMAVHFGDVESKYLACKDIIENNLEIFLGFYGYETENKLNELHEQLLEAGYQDVIDYINTTYLYD